MLLYFLFSVHLVFKFGSQFNSIWLCFCLMLWFLKLIVTPNKKRKIIGEDMNDYCR